MHTPEDRAGPIPLLELRRSRHIALDGGGRLRDNIRSLLDRLQQNASRQIRHGVVPIAESFVGSSGSARQMLPAFGQGAHAFGGFCVNLLRAISCRSATSRYADRFHHSLIAYVTISSPMSSSSASKALTMRFRAPRAVAGLGACRRSHGQSISKRSAVFRPGGSGNNLAPVQRGLAQRPANPR